MTTASLDATSLDAQSLMLVRVAALVALDAPPVAYLLNFGAGREVGLGLEDARGVLAAIAPIVGTARTVSALGNIARALGIALDIVDLDLALGDED
jgi:4-carboxymuconolactone decarboxylase